MKLGMMSLLPTCISLSLVAIAASESLSKTAFVKHTQRANFLSQVVASSSGGNVKSRALEEDDEEWDLHPGFRRRHVSLVHPDHGGRKTKSDFTKEQNCDQALLSCLPEEKCAACFRYLYGENVDWGTVTPETSCDDVLGFLAKKQYCSDMHADNSAKDAFCRAFDACAVWEDDEGEEIDAEAFIDCSSLKECDWPGFKESWLGDGICHDQMGGCYNTEVCGFDGGDCCEDTCSSTNYAECGHDGYYCRDTNSTKCDPTYSLACKNANGTEPDPLLTKCQDDEVKYKLTLYDLFGDGWGNSTNLTIAPADKKDDVKFKGSLQTGSKGVEYICLPKKSTCLHVDVTGGEWGNEATWEVRPLIKGAPPLAAGGAPMSCDFSVGGKACAKNSCEGRANVTPNNDPEYKEFKEMYTCIEQKCTIQVGICEKDATCSLCLAEEKADFCYGSDAFLAVVDCTMCQCTDRKDSDFCQTKLNPGIQPVISVNNIDNAVPADGSPRACSPAETMKGSDAVLTFAECSGLDQVTMLVQNYDQNKFGLLDQFEACAHGYKGAANHGGHTALGCMGILERATHLPEEISEEGNEQAIAILSSLLYHNANEFCECASKASADCPLCSSFINLKSLLYESMDGCKALDEIDCNAWGEFYTPCKKALEEKYGSIDFSNEETCQFVQQGCGGTGAFPAFRRLDCDKDLSSAAWDFYKDYAKGCLEETPAPAVVPAGKVTAAPVTPATPRPTMAPVPSGPKPPPTPRPTMKPYYPSDSSSANRKPYVPEETSTTATSSSANKKPYIPSDYTPSADSESGGKSHWLRNMFIVFVLGGAGFLYYKRRTEAFSFVRYRNTRNYAGGESEMYSAPYSGLTMDSGSGAFQPPSLPPTPSAIDGGMY